MSIKLCFNNEIHRVQKLPTSFSNLLESIRAIFSDSLPNKFNLSYEDSEGDKIVISTDDDLKTLLAEELTNTSKSVKVYITGLDNENSFVTIAKEGTDRISEISEKKESVIVNETSQKQNPDSEKEKLRETVNDLIFENIPAIVSLVKDMMESTQNTNPSTSNTNTSQKSEKSDKPVTHSRITCDGCGVSPVTGIRYKCSVCPDFDFCEKCEASVEHPHAFLKIKTPVNYGQETEEDGPHHFFGRHGGHHGHHGRRGHGHGHGPHHGRGPFGGLFGGFGPFGGGCPFKGNRNEEGCKMKKEFIKNLFQGFGGFQSQSEPQQTQNTQNSQTQQNTQQQNTSQQQQIPQPEEQEFNFNPLESPLAQMAANLFKNLPSEQRDQINGLFGGIPDTLVAKIDSINQPKAPENPKLDFEFVKEVCTIPSKLTVNDQILYKTIIIKNTGNVEWPKTVFLAPNNEVKGRKTSLTNLAAGKEMSVILTIDSPAMAGKYLSQWKLCYDDEIYGEQTIGKEFGLQFEIAGKEESSTPGEKKIEEKVEKKEKVYSEKVKNIANVLKDLFPDIELEKITEIVDKNQDLSMEELIDNYLLK